MLVRAVYERFRTSIADDMQGRMVSCSVFNVRLCDGRHYSKFEAADWKGL